MTNTAGYRQMKFCPECDANQDIDALKSAMCELYGDGSAVIHDIDTSEYMSYDKKEREQI